MGYSQPVRAPRGGDTGKPDKPCGGCGRASCPIALTATDAPYTFALRKDAQEETVLTLDDVFETRIPKVVESPALGIRLVLDVAKSGRNVD